MNQPYKIFIKFSLFFFAILLLSSRCQAFTTYTIRFSAYSYNPNSLNVKVGDTIKWIGDFKTYPMQSTAVPQPALAFGPIYKGDTFIYPVLFVGEYDFQNNQY